MRRIVQG